MMTRLLETAQALVGTGRGLLAMDESNPTCDKRFAKAGFPQTVEARRAYREMIVTTPGLAECISGVILYDEAIRQRDRNGTLFVERLLDAAIIPGIKVDLGAKDLALHPRGNRHRGPGRIARAPCGLAGMGRPLRQMARSDRP